MQVAKKILKILALPINAETAVWSLKSIPLTMVFGLWGMITPWLTMGWPGSLGELVQRPTQLTKAKEYRQI